MTHENIFEQDSLSLEKARIVDLLKAEGLTPENQAAVMEWTKSMEILSTTSSLEMVRFNAERADLYEAIGDIDEMFTCLDQALYQTEQELDAGNETANWSGLSEKIRNKIKELEAKYPPNS